MSRVLYCVDLGGMRYAEALELQREVARLRISGAIEQDVLLLVEHPHVVTLGRAVKSGAGSATLTASPQLLAARGVELFEVDRGGDVTYHGPGQLVGYPILDLRRHRQDLHWYLRQLEEALMRSLRPFGLAGVRSPGQTGVWVSDGSPLSEPSPARAVNDEATSRRARKIASIGVHARDWVTWHGFALNVATDLSYFDLMIPCGIAGVEMTSITREVARQAGHEEGRGETAGLFGRSRDAVVASLGEVFSLDPVSVSLSELRLAQAGTG